MKKKTTISHQDKKDWDFFKEEPYDIYDKEKSHIKQNNKKMQKRFLYYQRVSKKKSSQKTPILPFISTTYSTLDLTYITRSVIIAILNER